MKHLSLILISFFVLTALSLQAKEKAETETVSGCLTSSSTIVDGDGKIIAVEYECSGTCPVCYTIVRAGTKAKGNNKPTDLLIPSGNAGAAIKGHIIAHQVASGPWGTVSSVSFGAN